MTFQNPKINLVFPDLSYKIIGCVFNVHNELGGGHLEKSYHNSLKVAFAKAGLNFVSKKNISIRFSNERINGYEPDFVVEDRIVVELKRKGRITPDDFDQARRYLQLTGKKLTLLVHFGIDSAIIKRVVNLEQVE